MAEPGPAWADFMHRNQVCREPSIRTNFCVFKILRRMELEDLRRLIWELMDMTLNNADRVAGRTSLEHGFSSSGRPQADWQLESRHFQVSHFIRNDGLAL